MSEASWDFTTPKFDYTIIETPDHLSKLYEGVGSSPKLAFDFETTGLHYIEHEAAGISIANESHSWYVHGPAAMNAASGWIVDKMNDPKISWSGHNIKFDLHFLKGNLKADPPNIFDTEIAQWMINENDVLALKDLALTKLGYQEKLPSFRDLQHYTKSAKGIKRLDEVTIWDMPISILGPYAALDARLTFDLREKVEKELQSEGLLDYFNNEAMPFVKVLRDMERNGLYIDQEAAEKVKQEYTDVRDQLWEEWQKKTGGINPNSPAQLRDLLFGELKLKSNRKTQSGKSLSTDATTLIRLKRQDKSGIVDLLIRYREYDKLVGTYMTAFTDRLHDGYLHTNFNYPGTITGRLSSSGDLNFQNIPKRSPLAKAIRRFIIAEPGYMLVGADYSQMELRLLAHMSRDESMVRAFLWGQDIHQLTADLIGVPRYVGKTLNFGIIYGMGPRTLADNIEKDGNPRPNERRAAIWLDDYYNKYAAIRPWKRNVLFEAGKYGYITTIGGRHRHAVNLNVSDYKVRGRAERQLINSKIQGSAGDVINWAMNSFNFNIIEDWGAKILLQVHDELLFKVPTDLANDFAPIVQSEMERTKDVFGISVPIIAEPAVGPNWMEAKE